MQEARDDAESASRGNPIGHGHTIGVVTLLTCLVSLCGYLREATLAARFGVSAVMDSYFGAIIIPNTLYLILVVGTLSPIFIPILLENERAENRRNVSEAFSVMANFTLVCVTGVVVLSLFTAHRWLPWLFPGFSPITDAILLRLVYIVYPGVIFLAMAGILTALLNAYHKFAVAAIMPAIASVGVICAALVAKGEGAIYIVGAATSLGFLLQFLFLLPAAARLSVRYKLVFDFRHPAIRKLLVLGGPLFLYLIVSNASLIVERNLASRLSTGAVSAMTYAVRLFAVPANFLAAPLAIVSYPLFARAAVQGTQGELLHHVSRAFRFVVVLFLPITILVMLNALPLTRVLYERGHFRGQDSVLISQILMLYGIGILPNAIAVILIRCFFAIQDTVTPLLAESANLGFYIITASWFTTHYGIKGLAFSRCLSFILIASIFAFVLWSKRHLLRIDADVLWLFLRTAIASILMGIVNWMTWQVLQNPFDSSKAPLRMALVCVVGILSGLTFVVAARLLQITEVGTIFETVTNVAKVNFTRALAWLR